MSETASPTVCQQGGKNTAAGRQDLSRKLPGARQELTTRLTLPTQWCSSLGFYLINQVNHVFKHLCCFSFFILFLLFYQLSYFSFSSFTKQYLEEKDESLSRWNQDMWSSEEKTFTITNVCYHEFPSPHKAQRNWWQCCDEDRRSKHNLYSNKEKKSRL